MNGRKHTIQKEQWPNGQYKNQIDYIPTKDKRITENIEVLEKFKFNSEHRLVRGSIKFNRIIIVSHAPNQKPVKCTNYQRKCIQKML